MTNPQLITTPFAENGTKNIIPESGAAEPQLATMQAGFPETTQRPINEGGIPPERADFNGILNLYGQHIVHLNKGLAYEFDRDFANSIGGYPPHAELVMADGTRVVSTIQNNMNNPNIDLTGWRKGVSASDVTDASGKSQQAINNAILGVTYYAELEGFTTSSADNSAAWTALQAKMNAGDTVIFRNGTYTFLSPFTISKNIKVIGQGLAESAGTAFNFTNSTNGIVRTVRGGELNGIRVLGKQTATVFDFANGVFGTIGLWDKYDDTAKAAYVNTRNMHISGWDTGRVNAAGGSEIWAGAYRETYDTFIRGNRCGCVFLNGATHDKYYGGTISANSMIGIWAEAPRVQYNNISFIGTTIEGNGAVDSGAGYANIDYRTNVSIFAGANTAINLIGGYCEKAMTYAKDGGVINKLGGYEHFNSLNYANDATINMLGSSAGSESKLVVIPKARAMWAAMVRGSFTVLDVPDGIVARSALNSVDGYAMRSKPIPIKGNVRNKDVHRIKVSFSYKFTGGYTANTDLFMHPGMVLYSKTAGRSDSMPLSQFPLGMLKGNADGNTHSFEYYYQPRLGSTTLDESGFFDYIMLNFSFHNGATGTYPNFSSDNLAVEIYDLAISIYTDSPNSFVYDLRSGDTANRPTLNTTDKGYRYYDTTLNTVVVWSGTAWLNEVYSNDLTAGSSTSTSMASAANPINTTGKYRGRLVLNATNNKFYLASNSSPTDAWQPMDGTANIIPI